jgi:hypothetical protein
MQHDVWRRNATNKLQSHVSWMPTWVNRELWTPAGTGRSKSLCTSWLQYRKLQVMFKVSPASQSDCLAADRQGQGNTRLTLTPSVIPNSNYVITVSDWNCLKYFCVFLYCNHQVHRDFLITLYNNDSRKKETEIANGEIKNGTTLLTHCAGYADTILNMQCCRAVRNGTLNGCNVKKTCSVDYQNRQEARHALSSANKQPNNFASSTASWL